MPRWASACSPSSPCQLLFKWRAASQMRAVPSGASLVRSNQCPLLWRVSLWRTRGKIHDGRVAQHILRLTLIEVGILGITPKPPFEGESPIFQHAGRRPVIGEWCAERVSVTSRQVVSLQSESSVVSQPSRDCRLGLTTKDSRLMTDD